jgi:hypothetical protein
MDFADILATYGSTGVEDALARTRPYRPANGAGGPHANGAHDVPIPDGFRIDGNTPAAPLPQLVAKTLPRNGTALALGQSGAGKSFIMSHVAVGVAAGEDVFNRATKARGGVVILAPEGFAGLPNRIIAERHRRGITNPLPIAFTDKVGDLLRDDDYRVMLAKLRACAEWFQQRFGVPHVLTILDTITQCVRIRDENDNAEIVNVCKTLTRLAGDTRGLVLGVHHMGKDQDRGARGASAWRGNVDVILACTCDRDELTGKTSNHQISLTKSRDGPEGPISAYNLKVVDLGEDEDGDPYTTCIVEFTNEIRRREKNGAGKGRDTFADAVNEALAEHGQKHRVLGDGPAVTAVNVSHVRDAFIRFYPAEDPEKADEAKRKAWARALKAARNSHLYRTEERDGRDVIWRTS